MPAGTFSNNFCSLVVARHFVLLKHPPHVVLAGHQLLCRPVPRYTGSSTQFGKQRMRRPAAMCTQNGQHSSSQRAAAEAVLRCSAPYPSCPAPAAPVHVLTSSDNRAAVIVSAGYPGILVASAGDASMQQATLQSKRQQNAHTDPAACLRQVCRHVRLVVRAALRDSTRQRKGALEGRARHLPRRLPGVMS